MRLKILIIIIVSFFFSSFDRLSYKQATAIKKIIIDAGHGGRDTGAKGKYSFEKDICLDIALKLGNKIKEDLPDIEVIYTRTEDTYPEIKARANFANSNHGDLFLSIHVNAAPPIRHSKFIGNKTQVYYTGKGKKR